MAHRREITLITVVAMTLVGCVSKTVQPSKYIEIDESVERPSEYRDPKQLKRFYFGGVYRIHFAKRYDEAELISPRVTEQDKLKRNLTYTDGAIRVIFLPTPYGVRLAMQNQLDEMITLQGQKCAIIDVFHNSHIVELRSPTALTPDKEPGMPYRNIAPTAALVVDLDLVLPEYRSRINEWAKTDRERGAYLISNAPLPVFSSGYFLYPKNQTDFDLVKQRFFGLTFCVYLEFSSERGVYGYQFEIEPYRFADGTKEDWEDWVKPELSQTAIEDRSK